MPRSRNSSSVPRDLEQRGLCQMVTRAATSAVAVRTVATMRTAATSSVARTARPGAASVVTVFAGEPGAHRGQFLTGCHAAAFLLAFALRSFRARDVAVHFAARRTASALATAGRKIIRTHAVERGQFARFVVVHAGPRLGRVFGGAHLGDHAPRVALMQ